MFMRINPKCAHQVRPPLRPPVPDPPSQPVLVVSSLSLGTFRVDLSSTVSIQ